MLHPVKPEWIQGAGFPLCDLLSSPLRADPAVVYRKRVDIVGVSSGFNTLQNSELHSSALPSHLACGTFKCISWQEPWAPQQRCATEEMQYFTRTNSLNVLKQWFMPLTVSPGLGVLVLSDQQSRNEISTFFWDWKAEKSTLIDWNPSILD